jgi:hypothetical protein
MYIIKESAARAAGARNFSKKVYKTRGRVRGGVCGGAPPARGTAGAAGRGLYMDYIFRWDCILNYIHGCHGVPMGVLRKTHPHTRVRARRW